LIIFFKSEEEADSTCLSFGKSCFKKEVMILYGHESLHE